MCLYDESCLMLSILSFKYFFTVDFDKLGLTDNENPLGVIPPVFGRSMGRAAGSMLGKHQHWNK